MIEHNFSVLDHKILLKEDLKEECNEDIPLDRMRLRKKTLKQPSTILLDDMIFGRDVFINTSTELCVEILTGTINLLSIFNSLS
jgi:ubiquitin carboxyl-terminal hydrolase 47